MLVIRERVGHVEVLTLNRPEAANSLNPELMGELGDALVELLTDDDARAIVVTGAGERHFCAGMDLSSLGSWDPNAEPTPSSSAVASFLGGSFPKPLIAMVNGTAVGGGLEMAMACDLVVAVEGARFGLPEVKRGLYAAGGGTMLATRIPMVLALELGLTGRLIDSATAASYGLVNRVVPADELRATAMGLAEEIAANGPLAVQLTKQLMRAAITTSPAAGLATPEQQASIFTSADAREGATAFMEKRPAQFTGH